jgi:hypothetical protein
MDFHTPGHWRLGRGLRPRSGACRMHKHVVCVDFVYAQYVGIAPQDEVFELMCVVHVEQSLVDNASFQTVSLLCAGVMFGLVRAAHIRVLAWAHIDVYGLDVSCIGLGERLAGPAQAGVISMQVERPLKPIMHLAFMHACLTCSSPLFYHRPVVTNIVDVATTLVSSCDRLAESHWRAIRMPILVLWQQAPWLCGRAGWLEPCLEDAMPLVFYALHPCCLPPSAYLGLLLHFCWATGPSPAS